MFLTVVNFVTIGIYEVFQKKSAGVLSCERAGRQSLQCASQIIPKAHRADERKGYADRLGRFADENFHPVGFGYFDKTLNIPLDLVRFPFESEADSGARERCEKLPKVYGSHICFLLRGKF